MLFVLAEERKTRKKTLSHVALDFKKFLCEIHGTKDNSEVVKIVAFKLICSIQTLIEAQICDKQVITFETR
jgi:hypothetical protein